MLLPLTLALAGGLGWLAAVAEARVFVAMMMPISLGVGVGLATAVAVYVAHLDRRWPARAWGVLGALVAAGALWAGRYDADRARFEAEYRAARLDGVETPEAAATLEGMDLLLVRPEELARAWDDALVEETGHAGPRGWIELRLGSGIQTLSAGGFPAPGWAVGGFWGLELLVMGGLAASFCSGVARTGRCPRCDAWWVREELGVCDVSEASAALSALAAGAPFAGLRPGGRGRLGRSVARVAVERCPGCSEGTVEFTARWRGSELRVQGHAKDLQEQA
jgi:hypothetical protein